MSNLVSTFFFAHFHLVRQEVCHMREQIREAKIQVDMRAQVEDVLQT